MSSNEEEVAFAMASTEELIKFVRRRMKDKPPKHKAVLKCIEKYRLVSYVHNLIADLLIAWDDAGADAKVDMQTRRAEINRQLGTAKGWLEEVVKALTECEKSIPPTYSTLEQAESARKGFDDDLTRARDDIIYKLEREYYKTKILQCDKAIQVWRPDKQSRSPMPSVSSSGRRGKKRQADGGGGSGNASKRPRHDPANSTTPANTTPPEAPPPAKRWLSSVFPFGTQLAGWVGKPKNPAPTPSGGTTTPSPKSVVKSSTTTVIPGTKPPSSAAARTTTGINTFLKAPGTLQINPLDSPPTTPYIGSPVSTPAALPIPVPSSSVPAPAPTPAPTPIPNSKASTSPSSKTLAAAHFTPPKTTRSPPSPPPPAPLATKAQPALPPPTPPKPSPPPPPPPPPSKPSPSKVPPVSAPALSPPHPPAPATTAATTTAATTTKTTPNKLTDLADEYRAFEDFCAANDQPEGAAVDAMLERAEELRDRLTNLDLYDAMQEHLGVHKLQDERAAVEVEATEVLTIATLAESQQERDDVKTRLAELRRQQDDIDLRLAEGISACDAEFAGWMHAIDGLEKLADELRLLQKFGHKAALGYLGDLNGDVQEV